MNGSHVQKIDYLQKHHKKGRTYMDMLRYACKKIVRPVSTDFIRINDKELPMNAVIEILEAVLDEPIPGHRINEIIANELMNLGYLHSYRGSQNDKLYAVKNKAHCEELYNWLLSDQSELFMSRTSDESERKKVYLCGCTIGKHAVQQFNAATAYLKTKGMVVCNPVAVMQVLPKEGLSQTDHINIGVVLMNICRNVVVLPGYEGRAKCEREISFAKANEYPIEYLSEEQIRLGAKLYLNNASGIWYKTYE